MAYSIKVNGTSHSVDAPDDMPLLWVLRDLLGLTGTKYGCGIAQCRSCTVHLDGEAVQACQVRIADVGTRAVTTIEGLASGADLHPVQAAFKEHHGLQCGFCTTGMIMAASDMINRYGAGNLDEKTVRAELEGNICRCTGYHNIVKAILAASDAMAKDAKAA